MLYLLDANVLITAHNKYYPIDMIPEFWAWVAHVATSGDVKMPVECYEEVTAGKGKDGGGDELVKWLKEDLIKDALVLKEEVDKDLVATATETGYAPDLTDEELEKIGCDAFLVAYALVAPETRCIVTTEVSKPTKQRGNRHLPDVCDTCGVLWMDSFDMLKALKFSTAWKA